MINQSSIPAGKQMTVFVETAPANMDLPGITYIDGVPMMSHLEIALLLGHDRPDVVKRSIERLADQGVITFTPMVEPTPGGGKPRTVYYVDKRDSCVVVAQLSPEFTAKVIDRWMELEAQAPQIPRTFAEALRLAADTAEENERLRLADQQKAQYIEETKDKVGFMEDVFESSESIPVSEFGRVLKSSGFPTGYRLLKSQLIDLRFFQSGNRLPYDRYVIQGLFEVKRSKPNDLGNSYPVPYITPKGQTKLWMRLAEHFGIKKELPEDLKPYRNEIRLRLN